MLIVKVHELAEPEEIERRYDAINRFEAELAERGTTIIKCMLHISPRPRRSGCWPGSTTRPSSGSSSPATSTSGRCGRRTRTAYEVALERCSTDVAPWYVVPSDRKWYRNWAIGSLLLEALRGMDLSWPEPDYDVAEQRARLEPERPPVSGLQTPGCARSAPPATSRRCARAGRCPGLVEADDLGTYVCKFRGAGQGLNVLVAEVIVAGLARALGLDTPRLVEIDLDEAIARYEADEEVQDLLTASLGQQPRRRLPARLLRLRHHGRGRRRVRRAGCSGSTRTSPTSTAPGATPTCWSGTAGPG